MPLDHLHLRNFGPITEADVHFGDLTVFVGHQASGKSILLQTLRLLTDRAYITKTCETYGRAWNGPDEFADMYYGEGMRSLLSGHSITWNGENVPFARLTDRRGQRSADPLSFYIPAQRVLAFSREGWLRPFSEFPPGTPFALGEFSDRLRLLLELEFEHGDEGVIFPQKRRLPSEIRDLLINSVFPGFSLRIEQHFTTKRLALNGGDGIGSLPYMVWSAGQRECVPLLLGLYWLMPAGMNPRRQSIKRVVLEEPEMGLHPKAIVAVLAAVCELLARGYKVSLTTHSPQVLDLVWALGALKKQARRKGTPEALVKLLTLPNNVHSLDMARKLLKKSTKVYFFERGQPVRDISGLSPGSDEHNEASWGGLSDFSGRAAEVVSDANS